MSYESNIQASDHFFCGEDKILSYEVFAAGSTTTMENVSGFILRWTMRKCARDMLTKTTSIVPPDPGGITITGIYNSARAVNTQRVLVSLSDTDTENLAPGQYEMALKRLGTDIEAILSHGSVELQEAAIR